MAEARRRQAALPLPAVETSNPSAFAGIWEFARLGGEEILSTAMIVGEANPLVGGVHDRMPVMLMSEDYDRWLGATTGIDDLKSKLKLTIRL